ncbi:MAG: glycosyltransferase, partial [Dehalococcoidia bacterium]
LETYDRVRRRKPETQMVIANLLKDGPELTQRIELLRERGNAMGGVLVLTDIDRVGNVELSALRDEAAVLIHQGFPLGISVELLEEMWQGRPIVSGRSSVASAMLVHKKTGLLANTPTTQANAINWLLDNPAEAERIGSAAHTAVADRYLITHHLAAELKLFRQVLRRNTKRGSSR